MQTFNRKRLILAVSGFLLAIAVHSYNGWLSNLPVGLHATADDASYLAPAKNFLEHGIWKDNTTGESAYVQRPPLMGTLHFIGFAVFGKNGPVAVMIVAFLLHGLAIYALTGIFRRFLTEKQSLVTSFIYALLPCFWGFLSYQITEAVSASLVIFTLHSALNEKKYSPALTIFLFTCCWFLRPVLVLLFPIVVYQLIRKRKQLFNRQLLLNGFSAILCFAAIFLWEKRKSEHTGTWFELHPIYHETNQTLFRPVHKELSNLFRIWETKPEDFHALTGYCWNTLIKPDDPVVADYYFSRHIPLTKSRLERVLISYSSTEHAIQQQFGKGTIHESAAEKEASKLITDTRKTAIRQAKAQYFIKTPLKSAKELLSKSQLNLELFQEYLRGNAAIEVLRFVSLAVIVSSFLLSFMAFILKNRELMLIASGICLYLFYLFFIQRMCEDRYMLPALPAMLVCAAASVLMIYNRKKSLH